jgi:hypothetical protein
MATGMIFTLGRSYTRAEIRTALGDTNTSGGAWDTGYREWNGEYFVFSNVGTSGRTGHDYANYWDGERLVWQAKSHTKIDNPEIQRLVGGRMPVHVFSRKRDRDPFAYHGLARPMAVTDTTPVGVTWAFDADLPTPLTADDLASELEGIGFAVDPPGARTKSQRARLGDLEVYIKSGSDMRSLVVAPEFEPQLEALRAIPGVDRPLGAPFVHNASFTSFPRRLHTGKRPEHYGLDFGFATKEALGLFVAALRGHAAIAAPTTPAPDGERDPRTETESVRAARLGQSKFRSDLMDRWERQCALTGLPVMELLRASHIKPWSESSGTERHDPDNGLLLAVHVDGLFDRYLISFENDGSLICSPRIDATVLQHLGLHAGLGIPNLNDGNRRFLALHRAAFFQRNQTSA